MNVVLFWYAVHMRFVVVTIGSHETKVKNKSILRDERNHRSNPLFVYYIIIPKEFYEVSFFDSDSRVEESPKEYTEHSERNRVLKNQLCS